MKFIVKTQHTSLLFLLQLVFFFTTIKTQEEGESGETPEWEYRTQNRWARDFPECGGRHQSPVNIDPARTVKLIDGKLGSGLHLKGYSRFRRAYNVTNTGRSIQFTYAGRPETVPSISGVAVGGGGRAESEQFVLEQFHFHWGQIEGFGSEHTLDGDRYDMEVNKSKNIFTYKIIIFVLKASSSAL